MVIELATVMYLVVRRSRWQVASSSLPTQFLSPSLAYTDSFPCSIVVKHLVVTVMSSDGGVGSNPAGVQPIYANMDATNSPTTEDPLGRLTPRKYPAFSARSAQSRG
jgi:hypothetical protein